jgi:acetyl esterase/lipase
MRRSLLGAATLFTLSILIFAGIGITGRFLSEESQGRFSGTMETVVFKSVDGQELAMDLYYRNKPAQGLAPVHVFVHGGGWVSKDRHAALLPHTLGVFELMGDQGWVGVSADHRLVGGATTLDDAVADVKDLLRYLRRVGRDHGVDPDRMSIWGASTGGHLALMAALTEQDAFTGDPALRSYPVRVNSVVSWYGPTDLSAWARFSDDRRMKLEKVIGTTPDQAPGEYARLSPISHLGRERIPVLLMSGDSDAETPPEQSIEFYQAALQHGCPCTLVLVKGAGHTFMLPPSSGEVLYAIQGMTADFLMGADLVDGASILPGESGESRLGAFTVLKSGNEAQVSSTQHQGQ